jgi:hypothetical protein
MNLDFEIKEQYAAKVDPEKRVPGQYGITLLPACSTYYFGMA